MAKFKFYAEYSGGTSRYFHGSSEEDCICQIIEAQEIFGDLEYYTGVCDEDYEAGEYVGRENFIYE